MKKTFIVILILLPVFMFAQINSLLPAKYLGGDASGTIRNWKNSGSSIINAFEKEGKKIRIDHFIVVSEEGIFPGKTPVGEKIIQLLNKMKDRKGWKLLYFPKGVYVVDKEIVIDIPGAVIKGTLSNNEEEVTVFKFDLKEDVKNCFLVKEDSVGLEDFAIIDQNLSAPANQIKNKGRLRKMIRLSSDECWVRRVNSRKANYGHVSIIGNHNTVTACFFFDAHEYGGGGEGYGVQIGSYASYNRIENNIFSSLRHSVVLSAEPRYNVIAYNYSSRVTSTSCGGWIIDEGCGDIQLHGNGSNPRYSGPALNLFEGNIVQKVVIDYAHKHNGNYNTFFRNSSIEGLGIEESQNATQYQQNIIAFHGDCSCPWFSDACEKLLKLGFHKYWIENESYLDISNEYPSLYLPEKPEWYTGSWPFQLKRHYSDEFNPAKRRKMTSASNNVLNIFDMYEIEKSKIKVN